MVLPVLLIMAAFGIDTHPLEPTLVYIRTTHNGLSDSLEAPCSVAIYNDGPLTHNHYWLLCRSDIGSLTRFMHIIKNILFIGKNIVKFAITMNPEVERQYHKLKIIRNQLRSMQILPSIVENGAYVRHFFQQNMAAENQNSFEDLIVSLINIIDDCLDFKITALDINSHVSQSTIILKTYDIYVKIMIRHCEDFRIALILLRDSQCYMNSLQCFFDSLSFPLFEIITEMYDNTIYNGRFNYNELSEILNQLQTKYN